MDHNSSQLRNIIKSYIKSSPGITFDSLFVITSQVMKVQVIDFARILNQMLFEKDVKIITLKYYP
jgi:hypothetical protein